MAAFRQHVAVSTILGAAYGAAAYFGLGIDWAACVIGGGMAGLAGMLPDLDSPTGQPVREVMGFAAAMMPLLLVRRLGVVVGLLSDVVPDGQVRLSPQAVVVLMAVCYFAVRFGGAWLLDLLTVHRGMFHSIPAALVVALGAFLLCDAPPPLMRLFLAGGSLLGFLCHLVMDELWSVQWSKGMTLKKSAGSALKLFSSSIPATLATYSVLLGLAYLAMRDPGLERGLREPNRVPQVAAQLLERLRG